MSVISVLKKHNSLEETGNKQGNQSRENTMIEKGNHGMPSWSGLRGTMWKLASILNRS